MRTAGLSTPPDVWRAGGKGRDAIYLSRRLIRRLAHGRRQARGALSAIGIDPSGCYVYQGYGDLKRRLEPHELPWLA